MLALTLLGFSPRQSQAATTYFVSTTGTGNGSTWAMAGPLQTIITAAHSGDQVWVKYGTYTGNFTATDGVVVYGHFAGTETMLSQRQLMNTAYTTTLDGNSNGTVYTIPSSATGTNTLDGFTVQNATNSGLLDSSSDALVTSNCTFAYNSSPNNGGAISAENAVITNCVFMNNNASNIGGAIFGAGATEITDCDFGRNSAQFGGAIDTHVTTEILGCTFTYNTAAQYGGSFEAFNSPAVIKSCTFENNSAPHAGSIFVTGSSGSQITIEDCTSVANRPSAVEIDNGGSASSNCLLNDNLIEGVATGTNANDGIDIPGYPSYLTIANNTIVNTNVGINITTSNGAVKVANNIIYNNNGGLANNGTIPFISSHNDVYGNASYGYQGEPLSSSDLQVNPMFVDAATGDYQLDDTSPPINAGDNSYVLSGDKDLAGNPRIESTAVDIGAYEYTLIPTITSFTPTSGPVGTVVTVTGTNLENLISVRFHNANAKTFSVNGAGTQLTVTVPSGAGTGTFTVTTLGGAVTTKTPFTVTVLVKSLAFSPTTIAPGGSSTGTVTLTSPAPTGGAVVVITEGAFAFQVATVTIAAGQTTGTFTATATASAPAGAYPFTATYNKSSASATLTVN